MKPEDGPWLKSAHKNAEILDREIKNLLILINPIREDHSIITKYQDFWNKAKNITSLFKELKPLAQGDRDLLWKQFNACCKKVKEKQTSDYNALESLSQGHMEAIMNLAELAELRNDSHPLQVRELVERGQALKNAGEMLGKFKHQMIAKHKKICFNRFQNIRKTHDMAWESKKATTPQQQSKTKSHVRKNLEVNYERYRKAASALENFQISRDHIRTFLASCENPEKVAQASIQLEETEARIKDIEEGIRKLKKWIADDEQMLKEE
jgi:hypothetical protein